jgi:midasin (ATPase involved in ribosome maturation)
MEESNNKKPHISLRNMARSLSYIRANHLLYGVDRATYDGLYLGFGSALSPASRLIFEEKVN